MNSWVSVKLIISNCEGKINFSYNYRLKNSLSLTLSGCLLEDNFQCRRHSSGAECDQVPNMRRGADWWWRPPPRCGCVMAAGRRRWVCLWPDKTRPLSTCLWISPSRDRLSPTSLSRGWTCALDIEKKVIFNGSAHRLALVCRMQSLKFTSYCFTVDPAEKAEWHSRQVCRRGVIVGP